MYAEKNSKSAADFAQKKKLQLERAQALKDARDREKKRSDMSGLSTTVESMKICDESSEPMNKYSLTKIKPKDTLQSPSSSGGAVITSINDWKGNTVAERIVIRPQYVPSTAVTNVSKAPSALPKDRVNESSLNEAKIESTSKFHRHPINPSGRRLDLSDRPIMCSASNKRDEVIIGGSDHMLYSISMTDDKKPPKRMTGHTDWLNTIAFTSDNRVLSGGMDGNLFLWNSDRKTKNSLSFHTKSISCIVADSERPLAVSSSYDGNIAVWNLSSSQQASSNVRVTREVPRAIAPAQTFKGVGKEPFWTCAFDGLFITSGDKSGRILAWDAEAGAAVANIKAHSASITSLLFPSAGSIIISASLDGFIKVWDIRSNINDTGLVSKTLAHFKDPDSPKGLPTTCMGIIDYLGSGSLSYVISGGADSTVTVQDLRHEGNVVDRWNHCRNGVYSMAIADSSACVFVGDGLGMTMCYDISKSELKYGMRSSETGAVSTMQSLNNKLITGAEDGKALIYSYE